MRYSKNPELLALAKEAMWIEWPDADPSVVSTANYMQAMFKMPRNVRELPHGRNTKPIFTVGFSLAGKYRMLAHCDSLEHAARMADVLAIRLDEYRRVGIADNPEIQSACLNFPIQHALADAEVISDWLSRMLLLLVDQKLLVDSNSPTGEPGVFRPGRPPTASREDINKLKAHLDQRMHDLEQKLDTILFHLVTRPQIVIGPSNPTTPSTTPVIGSPLPSSPGTGDYPSNYPIVTVPWQQRNQTHMSHRTNKFLVFVALEFASRYQNVGMAKRRAYWAALRERVECKPPFVPTDEHMQLMADVESEITRLTT